MTRCTFMARAVAWSPSRWVRAVSAVAIAAIICCSGRAVAQCGPSAGSCFEANGTPGCNVVACCQAVCAVDPFCCETSWDSLCAGQAEEICATCGGAGAGSCFDSNGTPGCNNAACCNAVCSDDPFCCETSWDSLCAGAAETTCATCGGAGAGSCFESNGTPGCNNAACCNAVCADDPFCCETSWDSLCAGAAETTCATCGGAGAGSCFESNGTPGCNNAACCNAVCSDDPFCCDTSWDSICASSAETTCATCGGAGAGSCFESNGTPGCNNAACCDAVCSNDPFCCETSWDSICASGADITCATCGGAGAGDCCSSNGTPACNNAMCCNAVCAFDSFCCNVTWDSICASGAGTVPACGCGGSCLGDINNSGAVDGADLALLLGAWGNCGNCGNCPADLNNSCTVDGADLALLLGAWGTCP